MKYKTTFLIMLALAISLHAGIGVGYSSEGALPVELTTFTIASLNNNVILNWQTATEINNYGFEVERQIQDKNWNKVGFAEGHGNSNSPKYYSFNDKNVSANNYNYRLKQIDIDGTFKYSQIIEIKVGTTPTEFSLAQNYPNPFNPTTTISYSIPATNTNVGLATYVTLEVYDVIGNKVATLVSEEQSTGNYKVNFNATELSNGVYFYRIEAGTFMEIKKMILLK